MPSKSKRKQELIDWLEKHGNHDCDMSMKKAQILEKLNEFDPKTVNKLAAEQIADKYGIEINCLLQKWA